MVLLTRGFYAFLLVPLVLLVTSNVHGNEITLDDDLSLFYKNNYDILINKYEIDKSYADYVGAKVKPNPTLSVALTGLEVNHGLPNGGDNTELSVHIDQLIEMGRKREFRTLSAQETLESTKLTHQDLIRTLLIGFYTQYYSINLDLLNIDFAQDEINRFNKTLDISDRQYKAGFLSEIDYTKLKLDQIDLENSLITAESQLTTDLETFSFLLGGNQLLQPKNVAIQEDFPEYSEDSLVSIADQNRYDLLSLERQLKASEHDVALAKANRMPDLTVGGEAETYGPEYGPFMGLSFNINLPIFDQNQSEILRRKAEYQQTAVMVEKTKRQILSDIRQALNTYVSSVQVFQAYKKRKKDTEDLMQNSEKAFSLGGITVLDLIDTQRTYRDFSNKYNQALIQGLLNKQLIKLYTGEMK